ncbi:bromodomain-containing protein 7 [Galendromus occidentalis]|uniref:Bromodomain-containing protein 7 n=1 Tax=Galendromus occidentalis TaxID=34638 RepID=A0AAJ6W0B8_9ACAR|nr:bromodomain-containing protein 7 [Galendromus occidentalis]
MGSKKHKKHSKGRDEDSPGPPVSSQPQQATPIKLVLKMATGSGVAAVNSTLPASSAGAHTPSNFGGSSVNNHYVANPGISVRLVSDSAIPQASGSDRACPSGPVSVRRLENPSVPSTAASDSFSESSFHTKRHKSRSSDKKKKKKHKKHHHHCHHHHKDHHHKHSHHSSSTSSACRDGDKRRDRPEDDEDYDDDDRDDRPPKKRRLIPVTESVDNQPPLPTVPLRTPVGVIPPEKPPPTVDPSLQKLLGVLLNIVQERDRLEFFAWPVSDVIAPGYSSIIQSPMDLSTMRRKLEHLEYKSLTDFRADVKLICDNACQYNAADTIYYKEAKKLWRKVQKLFTREGVIQLDPNFEYIGNLSVDELGFDLRETSPVEEPAPRVTRNRIRVTDDEEKVGIVPPMKISLAASAVEAPPVGIIADRQRVQARDEPDADISIQAAAAAFKSPVVNDSHSEAAPLQQSPTIITERFDANKRLEKERPRATSPSVAKKSDPNDPEDFADLTPPPDDSPPEVILAHAQKMARFASQKLRRSRPNTQIHIVCSPEPGSTSLKFINPDVTLTEKYLGWRPKYPQVPAEEIDLEMLIGKLPYGMASLTEFKDDTRNVAKPINYLPLESGPPFSTYAPHYDSTFSNLTKVESDLIYTVYGDEIGVQYAESLMHFAKDSEETKERVDDLLDSLTDGEHRKAVDKIKSRELLRDDDDEELSKPSIDQTDDLLPARLNGDHSAQPVSSPSISTSGMAVHNESSQSPLPVAAPAMGNAPPENSTAAIAEAEGPSSSRVALAQGTTNGDSNHSVAGTLDDENEQKLQSKLTESTEMIETLTKLQKERLSKAPPNNLGNVLGPSPTELELAEKLAATLSELASHAKPGSIVSVEAIRRAMGITLPEKKVQPIEEPFTEAK